MPSDGHTYGQDTGVGEETSEVEEPPVVNLGGEEDEGDGQGQHGRSDNNNMAEDDTASVVLQVLFISVDKIFIAVRINQI